VSEASMNALTVAAQMLGELELTPGQLAQLHALNRKYGQRVYALMYDAAPVARELTEAEIAELRAMLASDILAMLTPEQVRELEQR
jgi:Spy/CpxP family protein refolding chaperone